MEAYPLSWPQGWKRSKYRELSKFKTGFGAARNFLFAELERMGATKVVVSTNVPLRNDGMPRANTAPIGGDPGVAVYFLRKGKPMVLACDQYTKGCDNVLAIAKTIEAMRGIERWGASEMMERAFSGFKQLAAENDGPSWWGVLQVRAGATVAEIETAFRALAKVAHPDAPTGSHDAMSALTRARDQGMSVAKQRV